MTNVVLQLDCSVIPNEILIKSPSSVDNLSASDEEDIRFLLCNKIQNAGILLRLPQTAVATAQVLFHRFYSLKSMIRHPVEPTAMACLYLASKIEECIRRVRDVINVFHRIRQEEENLEIQSKLLDLNYVNLKTQVIKSERRILKELGFCVHVKHPHKIIVMYLKLLGHEENQEFIQKSWNYMSDSLRSDVFVRYKPENIACACIYAASRTLQIPLVRTPINWFEMFHVDNDSIEDITLRFMRLNTKEKRKFSEYEKTLDTLRKKYQESRSSKI